MISTPGPSVPFRLLGTAALALSLACSGSGESGQGADTARTSGAGSEPDPGAPAEGEQATLPDSQLGDLEREDLTFSLPWTRGRINRDALEDDASASLQSVSFSRAENVDRMTLTFDSADSYPAYVVSSSVSPLPRCASDDTVGMEGEGLLRVRMRNVSAEESAAGLPSRRPELDNVTAVHRSCLEEDEVEWVLDVRRATYYRVLHASNPPRVVVDVMQAIRETAEGTER